MHRKAHLVLLLACPFLVGMLELQAEVPQDHPSSPLVVQPAVVQPAVVQPAVVQPAVASGAAASATSPDTARRVAQNATTIPGAPKEVQAFLERVFRKLPPAGTLPKAYKLEGWEVSGKPTEEAVGFMPAPGVDPDRLIARVMDVNHYKGNIAHVVESRAIPDPAFMPPQQVRFYQKVDVPVIATIHHELVLVDAGTINGYRVAYWYLLKDKTNALETKTANRSDFNVGAWITSKGMVAYALSSWPKRDDLNFFQWGSLTTGADMAASPVIKGNIEGMAAWALKK